MIYRVPLRPMPKPDIHPVRRVAMAIESLRYKYGLVKAGKDAPEPLTNYLDVSSTLSLSLFLSLSLPPSFPLLILSLSLGPYLCKYMFSHSCA